MREIFLRLDAGHLHDQALAAVTGYSPTAIRNWRNGRRQPPLQAATDLATVLGYDLVLQKKGQPR
jgi:transcriptional regulator with XRE-family HTH domain